MLGSSTEEVLAAAPAPATPATITPARRAWLDVIAVTMALVGGVLGILGAVVQELMAGGLLLAFVGAPIIEEALKPAGIYLLLLRWPQALRGRLHTAWLTALSGFSFGVIEALVYVTLYYPDSGDDFVLFRFTVPLAMHTVASFVAGLGLSRGVIDWAAGRAQFPKAMRNSYIAAVAIHAVYNTAAVVLALTGVFDFLDD
jgi:RsiW-degrading membrane proteinase PrsW (M82 family)